MRRVGSAWGVLILACLGSSQALGEGGAFHGEWRTSIGLVTLSQDGDAVTGTYGNANQFTIKGKVVGKMLTSEYQEGNVQGDARWLLNDTGLAFTGGFQIRGGREGIWNGWRPDPDAPKADLGQFGGTWLTTLGLMVLDQDGPKAKGKYAIRGNSQIEGDVTGRHFEYRYKGFRDGKGWFDLAPDGKTIAGAAQGDGTPGWYGWNGRPAPEFVRHAPLEAGKSVAGSTLNLLTYTVRAPESYDAKADKLWPTVLILHGSNMNGLSYVETIASAWPDVARDFILLGINGEIPSATGPDPRFNFSYVNFVGKSTFRGFPGTDRESPALVSEAMEELKRIYPISKYLVGGHSQGGFLTYSLLMNYPEQVAGAFPISAGLIVQCEPSAFADETLKKIQRRRPLAIIHGKTDPMVDPGLSRYAADVFREDGWPALRFIESDQGGHMFARLPVNDAIRWLDALTTDNHDRLIAFAEDSEKKGNDRDAIAALGESSRFKPDKVSSERQNKVAAAIAAKMEPRAREFLARIKEGKPGWIDDFLAFRDQYQFADPARDVMAAFDDLRARHQGPAQTAFNEARGLFQQGKTGEAYQKYQQIVDQDYASPLYRIVKRALAERK